MLRKVLCFLTVLCISVSLCGCNLFTADTAELLSPPDLTGDMLPIDKAIKASVGDNYTLEYPSRGDYRSAVIQQDINADGTLEAFAFYSTAARETTKMNINAVVNRKGKWSSVATQSINAGGVDRVEFCDLDHDGIMEILVGWEIYGTSELQLAVYSLTGDTLTQRMLEQYTHFAPCNLDNDNFNEIFIVRSFPSESRNTAHLYSVSKEGVSQVSSCELDKTAKTLNHPIVSTLSTGAEAIYIDEIKGVGAVTEVICWQKNKLANPLLDKDSKETTKTLRSAVLECKDINGDGILEIPVQRSVPAVSRKAENETLYLTEWCSFGGEALTVQLTAIMNTVDGYYYIVPSKWLGKIALLRDDDHSLLEIYRYNSETKSAKERLLYFKTVKKSDWDKGSYSNQDLSEIVNDSETSFVCFISPKAEKEGITLEKIKADFRLN